MATQDMFTGEFTSECKCRKCINDLNIMRDDVFRLDFTMMIVCPVCGNKRCPKATWHANECTGSNEPGQKGSDYE